jgi:hypothetical protein
MTEDGINLLQNYINMVCFALLLFQIVMINFVSSLANI